MIQAHAQRTLVKSPPELWSELSDEESLRRHLEGLSELKITRLHEERRIEWQARDARGSIEIEPSGWGTKVTLRLERDDRRGAQPPDNEQPANQQPANQQPANDRSTAVPSAREQVADGASPTHRDRRPRQAGLDALALSAPDRESAQGHPPPKPPADSEPQWPSLRRRTIGARIAELLRLSGRRERRSEQPRRKEAESRRSEGDPNAAIGATATVASDLEAKFEQVSAAILAPAHARSPAHAPAHPDRARAQAARSEEVERDTHASQAERTPIEQGAPSAGDGVRSSPDDDAQALLTALLDRLGQARHRPFSRA